MLNNEETYLLQKLKEGDIQVLEVVFNKHYSSLCKYLFLLFKNQVVVEHIAQDIFIYLWENRSTIEINTSLEAYLYSAGRYKALNQIRNAKRHEKINGEINKSKKATSVPADKMLEIKELQKIIEEAVASLPQRCQKIFRLSREEDLSYKEIAKILHISVNTVEGQIGIAIKKLRKTLRPFYLYIFFLV